MRPQAGFHPHVARLGSGGRPTLALHCTMAYSGAWDGLVGAVGDDVTLIAPDMPSHGRSPDWDEQSSFGDTVYRAALACLTEPMDVIGHSFGGATALRLAVEHPDLVRSVTMIEPVFFCIAEMDAPEVTRADRDRMARFYDLIAERDMHGAAREFNRMWADRDRWAKIPPPVKAAMARAVHVVPDTVGFLYGDDAGLVPRLEGTHVPALLIHGAKTSDIIKATNAGLARRMPDADRHEIADAGHMAPISHPREVADIWLSFLQSKGTLRAAE